MRTALLLALLLAGLLPAPLAEAQAAGAARVFPEEGDLATVFRFERDVAPRRGSEGLANPRFEEGFQPWSADDREVQGAADFSLGPQGATIRVDLAETPGTAYLRQRVPLAAGAYELLVETRGEGSFLGFALLVRESGFPPDRHPLPFLDTVYRPPVTQDFATHVFPWQPRDPGSTHAEVYLRVAFAGGDAGSATFRRASLVPVTDVLWDFGDGTPPVHGSAAEHRFAREGTFSVVSTVRHPGEAPARQEVAVRVANAAPQPAFSLARVGSTGRFAADAGASRDPDGVEARLANPDFGQGADGWGFSSAETGVEGAMDAEAGVLRLRAPPARQAGSVFAWQDVPVVPGRPYVLEALARDEGGIEAYEIILRESGGDRGVHDHVRRFPATGGAWETLRMEATPRYNDSTRLVVHLRALVPQGAAPDVSFGDVSLREGLRYAWSLDGQPLPWETPRIDFAPPPGDHVLALTVVDAQGAATTRGTAFNATLPRDAPRPAILAPPFARVYQPAFLFATPSRPSSSAEALANAGLDEGAAGWDLRASPGGAAAATGGVLTLRPGPGGFAEAGQRVPLEAGSAYEVRLRHRAEGVEAFEAIVLEATLDAQGAILSRDETIHRLPTGPSWEETRLAWTPRSAGSNVATVLFRALGGAGGGEAQVSDPSFAPAMSYAWIVGDGAPAEGFGVRRFFETPGTALVTLVVTDATGATNATSVQLPVLGNGTFRATPALSGGVHLAGNLTLHPRFAALEVVRRSEAGNATLAAPLRSSFVVADAAPPRDVPLEYALLVVLDNGTRVEAANATARLAPDAPVGSVEAPARVRRFGSAPLEAVAPADATAVTGRLSWGFLPVGSVVFKPANEPGLWTGTYRPGFLAPPVPLTLRVEAEGEEGARTALGEPVRVRVGLLAEGASSVALVLGALLLPGAAWGVREARRRGWRPWNR